MVITNQSAIARGLIDEPFLHEVHGRSTRGSRRRGSTAIITARTFPTRDDRAVSAALRLPQAEAGMIERACREMDLDPARSFMVGDRWLDVACGQAAGARAMLVRTGHGAHEEARGRRPVRGGCYPQQFDGGRRVDSAQLLALVDALKGRTVAVVGDVVADEFVYGRVARVSREAPVLILEYDSTEVVAGGAGNAANNVAALGGALRSWRWSGGTSRAAGCWRRCTRASIGAGIVRRPDAPRR